MAARIAKADMEWRAQDDARTLMYAEEVKADKSRLSRAKKAALKIAKEKEREVKAIRKIAKPVPKKGKSKTRVKVKKRK